MNVVTNIGSLIEKVENYKEILIVLRKVELYIIYKKTVIKILAEYLILDENGVVTNLYRILGHGTNEKVLHTIHGRKRLTVYLYVSTKPVEHINSNNLGLSILPKIEKDNVRNNTHFYNVTNGNIRVKIIHVVLLRTNDGKIRNHTFFTLNICTTL